MDANIYRSTPRQIAVAVLDCITADLVPFIKSSPGMGKSSIVAQIAREQNVKLIDHRLSTSTPEDMTGLPKFDADGFARFSPFADLFPLEHTPLPEGKEGWILFLDEFNSASKAVQAAAYKLVLDRMVGQYRLHDRCRIVTAGNLSTDRAITNTLSTAMQSRVVHLEMQINFDDWLTDVAFAQNYDKRIIAFLNMNKSKLMDFNPDHNESTFCCPRTWEFMNRLIQGNEVTKEKINMYAGTITSGVAIEFVEFTRVFEDMIPLKEVLDDPDNCRLPSDKSRAWAMLSHLMEEINEKNADTVFKYTSRFDLPLRIVFIRSAIKRKPKLGSSRAYADTMVELSKYLH